MPKIKEYLETIAVLNELKRRGVLSDTDYKKAEKHLSRKYGLKKNSVFRPQEK